MASLLIAVLAIATYSFEQPTPEPTSILDHALTTHGQQESAQTHYVYREQFDNCQPGSKILHTVHYDWISLEAASYRKLVAINGKPLKNKCAQQEDRRFQMTRTERCTSDASKKANPFQVKEGVSFEAIIDYMTHDLTGQDIVTAELPGP